MFRRRKSESSLLTFLMVVFIPPLVTLLSVLLVRLLRERRGAAPVAERPGVPVRKVLPVAEIALESTPAASPEPAQAPAPAVKKPRSAKSGAAKDDLTIIEGIGPRISQILSDAGISSFKQLADQREEEIRKILEAASTRIIANPETWPEQARLAEEGKFSELQELTDRLKGGRRA